ncbi:MULTISPECIES: hypothetical protein [Staphylococcus]|uniref:Uncharacterized protein n=1 Tax=Staphylococcus hsinchuensis TaxID=3051183 RepID=A0ABZ3ECP0_9STAP|nr:MULTISPECIES: hypothetical protein [unclassified Staphylococcus]
MENIRLDGEMTYDELMAELEQGLKDAKENEKLIKELEEKERKEKDRGSKK